MHTTARAERVSHLSVQGYIARAATVLEGWPSGLRRTLGKRVYGKPYRGFESHSLRQRPVDHIRANTISSGFILTERSSGRSGGKEHRRGDSPIRPGLASVPASRTGSIWESA